MNFKKTFLLTTLVMMGCFQHALYPGYSTVIGLIPDGSDESWTDFSDKTIGRAQLYHDIDWSNCEFIRAKIGAEIFSVNFSDSDFTDARFTHAYLAESIIHNAIFDGASFTQTRVYGCLFSDCSFVRFTIPREILPSNKNYFNECELLRCDFSQASLATVFIWKSNCTDAIFQQAHLQESTFMETILRTASFQDAHLHKAQFIRANMEGANFKGADLSRAQFLNSNLSNIQFDATTQCVGMLIDNATLQTVSVPLFMFLATHGAVVTP